MKKIVSIVTVLFGMFFLTSQVTFANQDNYSEDQKTITFKLIKDGTGTTDSSEVTNPPGGNDGDKGSNGDNISKLPQTGEAKALGASFLGVFLLGLSFLIILWKRRKNDDQQEN